MALTLLQRKDATVPTSPRISLSLLPENTLVALERATAALAHARAALTAIQTSADVASQWGWQASKRADRLQARMTHMKHLARPSSVPTWTGTSMRWLPADP
jgi:hypothetical protein